MKTFTFDNRFPLLTPFCLCVNYILCVVCAFWVWHKYWTTKTTMVDNTSMCVSLHIAKYCHGMHNIQFLVFFFVILCKRDHFHNVDIWKRNLFKKINKLEQSCLRTPLVYIKKSWVHFMQFWIRIENHKTKSEL